MSTYSFDFSDKKPLKDSIIFNELTKHELRVINRFRNKFSEQSEVLVSNEPSIKNDKYSIFIISDNLLLKFAEYVKPSNKGFSPLKRLFYNEASYQYDFSKVKLFLSTFENTFIELSYQSHYYNLKLINSSFDLRNRFFCGMSIEKIIEKLSFILENPFVLDRYNKKTVHFIQGKEPTLKQKFVIKDKGGYKTSYNFKRTDNISEAKVYTSSIEHQEHYIVCDIVNRYLDQDYDRIPV